MAISALGNIHFVNQNVGITSTQVGNELAKEGYASVANMQEFEAKEKVVNRLEKVAETNAVQDEIKEKQEDEESKKKRQEQRKKDDEQNDDAHSQDNDAPSASHENDENLDEDGESNHFKNSHKIKHLDMSI